MSPMKPMKPMSRSKADGALLLDSLFSVYYSSNL